MVSSTRSGQELAWSRCSSRSSSWSRAAVKRGDRIQAEVVRASQDVLRRVGLAQRRSRVPVGRSQEVTQAGAPVSREDCVLDVVVVGRAERDAALQEVVSHGDIREADRPERGEGGLPALLERDRKSTRLNSSHGYISYAVFCLKKKKK